jgi:uncharacterized protein (DUF4415 family)
MLTVGHLDGRMVMVVWTQRGSARRIISMRECNAEAPEWTDEQIAAADLHEGGKLVRRGRPPSANRKIPVKLRIDPDLVAALRASGPGWHTRLNELIREAVQRAKPGFGARLTLRSKAAPATRSKSKAAEHMARIRSRRKVAKRQLPKAKRA